MILDSFLFVILICFVFIILPLFLRYDRKFRDHTSKQLQNMREENAKLRKAFHEDVAELILLYKAVQQIQHDIFDSTNGVEYFNITLETNGAVTLVKLFDIVIWNSEDDDRKYYEETDTYEPFEIHLRGRIHEELRKIQRVKVWTKK